MSAAVTDAPRDPTNPCSVEKWAEVIRADLGRAVEGIIAAGRDLQGAKSELDRSEFLLLLERLKISESAACKFMTIAASLSDFSHCEKLPPSWGTLYELSGLPTEFLEQKIADGTITPEITRKRVMAMESEWRRAECAKHWQGMPAYRNDPPKRYGQVKVLFARREDMEAFAELIDQPITDRTKAVWYPAKAKVSRKDFMWHGNTSRMDKTFYDDEPDSEEPEAAGVSA
jgi:hypothetical protein